MPRGRDKRSEGWRAGLAFAGSGGIPYIGEWCPFWGSRVARGGAEIMKTCCLSIS